jgi:hypothetical protein
MTMQNNIDIIGRHIRRNMFQLKSQTAANKIDNQRPLGIAVAIPAHNRERWADRTQLVQNDFRAHVAQVPDFVRVARKIDNFLWQLVMSVRQNKNLCHTVRRLNTALPRTLTSILRAGSRPGGALRGRREAPGEGRSIVSPSIPIASNNLLLSF